MALREVLEFPDPRLRQKSKPIERIDDQLRQLAADLLETMYDEPGIGLAAPQVGVPVRLIVLDTDWVEETAEREPLVVVNPEIVHREGELFWTEGCLSVPDLTADVERAAAVSLRGLDLEGRELKEETEGLRAVCFQHEIDHLDGILFLDRISRLKRNLYIQKRKKVLRSEGAAWSVAGERPRAPTGMAL